MPFRHKTELPCISWSMNLVFILMLLSGLIVMTINAGGDAALEAMLSGAGEAVTLCVSLMGAYFFWMGLMGVVKRCGLMDSLSRLLAPVLRYLFPKGDKALPAIAMNLSANMLGMGNAATPYGIESMRLLQKQSGCGEVASYEMCVLLAINSSCLELLPSGLIALRQACGSTAPASIMVPTFLSSACATITAVVLCRLCKKP